MKLFIFNSNLLFDEYFKNKKIYKLIGNKFHILINKEEDYIIFFPNNSLEECIAGLTHVLYLFKKINIILYFGSCKKNNKKYNNEIILINSAFNPLIDLSVFGYDIGQYPGGLKSYNATKCLISKYEKILINSQTENILSSNLNIDNNEYKNWINNNLSFKDISFADKMTFSIYYLANKFNKNVLSLLINSIDEKDIFKSLNNVIKLIIFESGE